MNKILLPGAGFFIPVPRSMGEKPEILIQIKGIIPVWHRVCCLKSGIPRFYPISWKRPDSKSMKNYLKRLRAHH